MAERAMKRRSGWHRQRYSVARGHLPRRNATGKRVRLPMPPNSVNVLWRRTHILAIVRSIAILLMLPAANRNGGDGFAGGLGWCERPRKGTAHGRPWWD